MKKIFLAIILIFLFLQHVYALPKTNDEYEQNYILIKIADQVQNMIKKQYNIDKTNKNLYPEYYGGIFISDDGKNVVLQIVADAIPTTDDSDYKFYNKLTTMSNLLKIEYVNSSFNELNRVNTIFSEYIFQKTNDDILGCYIDVEDNKVAVELNAKTRKAISNVLSVILANTKINYNSLKFVEIDEPKTFATTIKSGGQIYGAYSGNGYFSVCSMGFRTRYNNQNGYVTAGHCLKGGTIIASGRILFSQFSNNERYDYGFVATNSEYTASNTLQYPSGDVKTLAVVNYCPNITVNMAVAKSGKTTGYTSGKIKGLNQTAKYHEESGTIIIKGLVKTNLESDSGDSGAPVFIPRADANGGPVPIGVVSGGSPGILGVGRTMYFTHIDDMLPEIQVGRY